MDDEGLAGVAAACQRPVEEETPGREASRAAYGIQDVPECVHVSAVPDCSDRPANCISAAVVESVAARIPAGSRCGAVPATMLIRGG